MNLLAVDFESYYDDEVSIKTLGTVKYIETTDIYMVSMVGEDGFEWVGHPKDAPWERIHGNTLLFHNRGFDGYIMLHLRDKGIIPSVYEEKDSYCTTNCAAFHQHPRSLKDASKIVLGMDVSKDVRKQMKGKQWDDMSPEFQKEVSEYALHDSRLCLMLWQKLGASWPEKERRLANLNDECGWRGIPVDEPAVDAAIESLERQLFDYRQQIPWSGDESKALLSMKHLAEWCRETGLPCPRSLAKDSNDFQEWADKYGEQYPVIHAMSNYRRVNTFLEKVKAIKSGTVRGRYRYSMKYHGAHTGRFSGSGGVNMQNLPRDEMFGVNMRHLFKAPPGKKFIASDLSQIEPRVLCKLVGDEAALNYFRQGLDAYETHARLYMGYTDPRPLKDVDKKMRQFSKARTLGLSYGCGPAKFVVVAKIMAQLDLSAAEAERTVYDYRNKNQKVVKFWKSLDNALRRSHGDNLAIKLPSGRVMNYCQVRVGSNDVTCMAVRADRMVTTRTWGSQLAENVTQSVARDVLIEHILLADDAGLQVLWTVHDEIILEVDEETAERDLKRIEKIMSTPPDWWPDLPLAAEAAILDKYSK